MKHKISAFGALIAICSVFLVACGGDDGSSEAGALNDDATCSKFVNHATEAEQEAYLGSREDWAGKSVASFIKACTRQFIANGNAGDSTPEPTLGEVEP